MDDLKLLEKINKLTKDQKEIWLERAAIMEYDGGLTRREANRRAYEVLFGNVREGF